MKYLLGVDFGGGASKATLIDVNGSIVATSIVEYPTSYPKQGYAEQDPMDWYKAIKANIATILNKSGISASDIMALCLDAATHTAVLLDDSFNVLRPAIYWTDSRSIKECETLIEKYDDLIIRTTLHRADTIWTLPQLMWVRDNEPEIWNKTKRILFAKDYIRYLFTGEYCTDYIEAQGSMMFDYNTMAWSKELCDILGFDIANLPDVIKPNDILGYITEKAAEETGLSKNTKVICGTTDTALEVFASGAIKKGQMTIKLATAGRICVVTEKAYPHQHLINYSHVVEGLWYPGTATKSCAASYRWYRDTFGGNYKELDEAASEIPVGSEGLIFHPYLNGELTPYANPKLCASFTGIRAGHTKAHFNRAVLEGVAYSLLDCMKTLEQIGIPHDDEATIIGGGAVSPLWRQIVADVLNIRLKQVENSDSSFGAAILAGVALNVFDGFEDAVNKCTKTISLTTPNGENTKKYAELFDIYKDINKALAPIYSRVRI
ncbi:MAG: xylulokinase [Candidatus Petromonas sp.]|nr:xylulokinase [Candidatus Petromonas sp.]